MTYKVAVIIPCYKASGFINNVINKVLYIKNNIKKNYDLQIYLINDNCPEKSWEEVENRDLIKIINHQSNKGVGEATITGFNYALEENCEGFIKIDADGQHNPNYLIELIPYLYSIPNFELVLIKGTRYFSPYVSQNIPITRRIGSLILEPIARAAISYRRLTDVANGYLAFNKNTIQYILSPNLGKKLESRYLFESSLIQKCSELNIEIHEFEMASRYPNGWKSSLKSGQIIIPLIIFWFSSLFRRIVKNYILTFNLGTLFLVIGTTNFSYALKLYLTRIYSNISDGIMVSAGTSSIFTSSIIISIFAFCLFLFYDYTSGKTVKKIRFKALLEDINSAEKR